MLKASGNPVVGSLYPKNLPVDVCIDQLALRYVKTRVFIVFAISLPPPY